MIWLWLQDGWMFNICMVSSGLVLHEEHIEILTPDYKQLKKDIAGKTLEEGTLHFTGRDYIIVCSSSFLKACTRVFEVMGIFFLLRWIPEAKILASHRSAGIARLTWLVDLFGELTVTAASLEEKNNTYMKMTAHFLTQQQKWVHCGHRQLLLQWKKSLVFKCVHQKWIVYYLL